MTKSNPNSQSIPRKLAIFGWLLFFLIISYVVFSALWGNTESTIGQRGNTFLFLGNVFSYLIFIPQHIGGLIFDLPFSLFMRPEYIFYLLGLEIGLGIWLIMSKQLQKLILKFGLVVFIGLGLLALAINLLTIQPCIIHNQYCLWWRIYTPNIVGLFGMTVSFLYPLAWLIKPGVKSPQLNIKKALLSQIACCFLFILIYFISIYISWEMNAKFARSYTLKLMESYQNQP